MIKNQRTGTVIIILKCLLNLTKLYPSTQEKQSFQTEQLRTVLGSSVLSVYRSYGQEVH